MEVNFGSGVSDETVNIVLFTMQLKKKIHKNKIILLIIKCKEYIQRGNDYCKKEDPNKCNGNGIYQTVSYSPISFYFGIYI